VLDQIVDGYVYVANGVAQDISEVEEAVFSPIRSDDAQAIYRLKRENLEIRRAVAPLTSAAELFVARNTPAIPSDLVADFQDLGEHILRVHEQVDSQDALLTTVLTASMSRQSLQQNEDMRKISAWVAIAAVPTMIAGIYGMNFEHMPELPMKYGYGGALALMGGVCFGMWRAFKRSGWL
ncbi:MAG: magnesium transporter CorA, partial [Actinobacteria bacterium]|nr:magnesium transporter CorA [Actinomycetota bacterium]